MKHAFGAGLVVFAMALAPVFAQQPTSRTDQPRTAKPTTQQPSKPAYPPSTQATAPATGKAAMADQRFVKTVAADNLAEVQLGQMATTKASNDQVKSFAQRMVDDHSKANDELKTLAASKSIMLPTEPDAKHKAAHDRLMKLSGAAFDWAYLQDMVNGHRTAVNAFRNESRTGKDADIKAWATKTLPTIEEHLKLAQQTAGRPVGTAGKK